MVKVRKERRALVYVKVNDRISCGHFAWFPGSFRTALLRSGGLSPGEGWDAIWVKC